MHTAATDRVSRGAVTAARREAERSGGEQLRTRPPLRRLAAWYVASRAVVWAAVLAGWTLRPDLPLVALLRRLDASRYIDIAREGYAAHAATPGAIAADPAVLRGAFFPLWPMLVRVTTPPGLSTAWWATLLATALGFGVVVASWLLVRGLGDADAADRAALLTCCFPGAVVLSTAYAEALTLCLVCACLLAVRDRRWWMAGLSAALATAARPNAIALLPALAWVAVVAIRDRRDWTALATVLLAPLGVLGFHGFLWWRTGRRDAWQLIQRNGWDERIDFGTRTASRIGDLVTWDDPDPGTVLLGFGMLVVIVATWALWRWRPPVEWVLYAAGVLGLAVGAATLGPRPRFVFTALPLVWALGAWLRGSAFRLAVVLSTGGLAALAVMYIVGSVAKP